MWKSREQMEQFRAWVDGESRHGSGPENHCPDFSCCGRIHLQQPKEVREAFWEAYERDDKAAVTNMMMGWMQRSLRDLGISASAHVVELPNAGSHRQEEE